MHYSINIGYNKINLNQQNYCHYLLDTEHQRNKTFRLCCLCGLINKNLIIKFTIASGYITEKTSMLTLRRQQVYNHNHYLSETEV